MKKLLSLVLAVALLAACVHTPPEQPPPPPAQPPPPVEPPPAPAPLPPPPPVDQDARRMLEYYARLRPLAREELNREVIQLGEPRGPLQALELALALGLRRGGNDLARAQMVLENLLRGDAGSASLRNLAQLLLNQYAEQRRLDEQNDRLGQQLRDAQRRAEQLQEKLDALRAIEQSLPARTGRPNGKP